jgi:hypothetical protein
MLASTSINAVDPRPERIASVTSRHRAVPGPHQQHSGQRPFILAAIGDRPRQGATGGCGPGQQPDGTNGEKPGGCDGSHVGAYPWPGGISGRWVAGPSSRNRESGRPIVKFVT